MSLYDDIAAYQPFNEQEAIDKQVILRALREDQTCFERSAQAHMACSIWVVDPAFEQTLLVYHNIYDSWSWIGGHADGERDLATVALRELAEETGVTGAKLLTCEMPTENAIADAKAGANAGTGAEKEAGAGTQAEADAGAQADAGASADGANAQASAIVDIDANADASAQASASVNVDAGAGANANTPASATTQDDDSGQEETTPKKQGSASTGEKKLGRHDRPRSPIFSLEVLTVDGHEKHGAYVSSHLHLNVTYLAVASPAESLRIKPDENSGVRWVPLDQLIPLSTEPWIRTRIYGKFLDKLRILRKEGALHVPEV